MGRTLQELVLDLTSHGDRSALIDFAADRPDVWSYRRLDTALRGLAAGLLAQGLGPGDRVAIVAPNSVPVVLLRLALLAAGIVAVPLDDQETPDNIERQLLDSGADVVFATREHLPVPDGCRFSRSGALYVLDDEGTPAAPSWTALMGDGPAELATAAPDDICAVVFTSGTTGAAKAVPLSHANLIANVDALTRGGFIDSSDRALLPLPLHHAYPFIVGLLVPLSCGATVILPRGVSGPEIAQGLGEGRATAMVAVPRIYAAMADGIRARIAAASPVGRSLAQALLAISIAARRRLGLRAGRLLLRPLRVQFAPALRLLACGGAHLDTDVAWTLEGMGFEVLSGYGLVETASVTAYNRRRRGRIGTEGPPVPGTELRIAQPDAEGIGEIEIRGPHVFAGYENDEVATRAAFTADGWFRSGDRGRIEADGSLVVVGRSKEIIVLSGGKNIVPEEIESAIAASPYVSEVAVFERGGDLRALVVPDMRTIGDAGTSRIDALLRVEVAMRCATLAPHKRVTGFRLSHAPLPRTRIGKIQRFRLPAAYEAAKAAPAPVAEPMDAADRALLAQPQAARLWRFLQTRFADKPVSLDTSLSLDLGVDSFGWIELALDVERETGAVISEEVFAQAVTIRDLLRHVAEREDVAAEAAGPPQLEPGSVPLAFLFYCINRVIMAVAFRLRTVGAPPVSVAGPMLLVPNHASDLDPLAVAAAMPWRVFRRLWWGADVTRLYSTPGRRWFARSLRIFPVDDRRPAQSMANAQGALATGDNLVWFAEGWRTPDGHLQPFLGGVGRLAKGHRPTIVPMWIDGTFEALPRHRRWPRFVRITVVFGDAVPADALDADATPAEMAETIRAHVAALSGSESGSPPYSRNEAAE